MPSLIGTFTGASQKKYADEAYQKSSQALQQGFDQGSGYVTDYYNKGRADLDPYAQQGQRASGLLGRYLGLDGADAQRQQMQQYAGGDPFRQFNEDNGLRALMRQFNGRGMMDSGNARLAMSRAQLERGSQDYNGYINQLMGMNQSGMGAANQLAQMAQNTGGLLGQMRTGLGNSQAQNAIQYGNAKAAADSALWNNIIKVGSIAASAMTGMPVGMGGQNQQGQTGASPYGNNFFSPGQMQQMNGYF